ncbi:MAG: hypothetical protein WHV67_05830 [Thermoanaerobaculia bacterium]
MDLKEENKRIRMMRIVVDLNLQEIATDPKITLESALNQVEAVKNFVLSLFPEKEDVFELVLRPRFMRIINERFLINKEFKDEM